MKFVQKNEPDLKKPLMIAAMQDMGDVGSIVVDFINSNLDTIVFREVQPSYPAYVIDNGGYILANGDNKRKQNCIHWVLAYKYINNGTQYSDFIISDPEYYDDIVDGKQLNLFNHPLCLTKDYKTFIFYTKTAGTKEVKIKAVDTGKSL